MVVTSHIALIVSNFEMFQSWIDEATSIDHYIADFKRQALARKAVAVISDAWQIYRSQRHLARYLKKRSLATCSFFRFRSVLHQARERLLLRSFVSWRLFVRGCLFQWRRIKKTVFREWRGITRLTHDCFVKLSSTMIASFSKVQMALCQRWCLWTLPSRRAF